MSIEIDSIGWNDSIERLNYEEQNDRIDQSFQKEIGNRIGEVNKSIRNSNRKLAMGKYALASFLTESRKPSPKLHMDIGFINGVANSKEDALGHITYLMNLVSDIGMGIHLTYNNTRGLLVDAAEALFLNYHGISRVAAELRERWTTFHNVNQNFPYQKILHICHSAGALHTKIALQGLPEEIRNRVIVIAVAPATVVPKKLCYDSFNYCSAYDPIPQIEPVFRMLAQPIQPITQHPFENREELIFLKPKQGEPKVGHDFQHPMYKPYLRLQIKAYLIVNGVYRDDKK